MDSAALHNELDTYRSPGRLPIGRVSAGAGFLRAFVRYAEVDTVVGYVRAPQLAEDFAEQIARIDAHKACCTILPHEVSRLRQIGCIYSPGPASGHLAQMRLAVDSRSWSLCGSTFTLSSKRVMKMVASSLVDPVESWDAVVCISQVARTVMETMFARQEEYLWWRLGARTFVRPQLPVIPLGVHIDDFATLRTAQSIAAARARLGVEDDDIAVLFFGRLSFHAKAHPWQMMRAIQDVAMKTGKRIHLVMCGVYATELMQKATVQCIHACAPDIRIHTLNGKNDDDCATAWCCADIFCSLSDNIQETQGLTPIEAMASGLPVVVTDWNGYKETVRDGVDGFRIPTVLPASPAGVDFATNHSQGVGSYDLYIGRAALMCAVDPRRLRAALRNLVLNKSLREKMGRAGARRAREVYDWRLIIKQYQQLWGELAQRRRAAWSGKAAQQYRGFPRHRHPQFLDPFALFESYPTWQLHEDMHVSLIGAPDTLRRIYKLSVVSFAGTDFLPRLEVCHAIMADLGGRHTNRVGDILARATEETRQEMIRALMLLAKLEMVALHQPRQAGSS